MKIIDAHTGRQGDVLPMPGHGEYKIVELSPGPALRALNDLGISLFGWGLAAPKIRVESKDPALNGQWIPLMVRKNHPCFPGQTVAFIPS